MSEKPDWFKMYPAQFLQDGIVDAMSAFELGATFRLLCRQWLDGDLADDKALLARQSGLTEKQMGRAWPLLSQFFPLLSDGRRANRFMWQEREVVVKEMELRKEEGRKAAERRWKTKRAAAVESEGPRELSGGSPNGSPIANPIADPMQDKDKDTDKDKDKEGTLPSSSAYLAAWNENRGTLPEVLKLNAERQKNLQTRIRDGLTIERFTEAVRLCASTPFLAGRSNSKWRASFDWLIKNDSNLLKVLERKYADSDAPRPTASPVLQPDPDPLPHRPNRALSIESIRAKAGIQ